MNETDIHAPAGIAPRVEHSLAAADRREITVRGVREVLSFDEANIRLITTAGILNLEGRDLRIHVLNTKDAIVAVTGMLDGLLYEDTVEPEHATGKGAQGASARIGNTKYRRGLFR